MADSYAGMAAGSASPARKCIAIAGNDGADLADVAKALYITTAGNIKFTPAGHADASPVGPIAVAAGIFPVMIKRIWSTGLTAAGLALYD